MSKKQVKQTSIWSLIRQIIAFFLNWRSTKKEKAEKAVEEVRKEFESIENKYDKQKKKELEDRLNNMF